MDCELDAKTNGEYEDDCRHSAELDPKQAEGSKELGHQAPKDDCDDGTRPGGHQEHSDDHGDGGETGSQGKQ